MASHGGKQHTFLWHFKVNFIYFNFTVGERVIIHITTSLTE